MFVKYKSLYLLSVIVTMTGGSVRFTKEPPKIMRIFKDDTARLVWEYHVDDKDNEFDINSPKWNFRTSRGVNMNIGSEDMFQNWKWVIHRSTCPPRLLNPTRVFKESLATLVIKNVTAADSGIYECSLVLLRASLPITSKVELVVLASTTVKPTQQTTIQPTSASAPSPNTKMTTPSLTKESENVTTKPLLLLKGNPMINISFFDKIVKSWYNRSLFLRCIVNGSFGTNITWYSPDGMDITNASRPIPGGSMLSLITLKDNDYGVYTCRAENTFGFDELKIDVVQLCNCSLAKNSQEPKAAFIMHEDSNPNDPKQAFIKREKLYIVCTCVIGLSWILDVFLILTFKSIGKSKASKGIRKIHQPKSANNRNRTHHHHDETGTGLPKKNTSSPTASFFGKLPQPLSLSDDCERASAIASIECSYNYPGEAIYMPSHKMNISNNSKSPREHHYQSLCFKPQNDLRGKAEQDYQNLNMDSLDGVRLESNLCISFNHETYE